MNEDVRIDTQLEYHISDTDHQEDYDGIVCLAAFICQAPIAAVTLLDSGDHRFKSVLGLSAADIPRDAVFCAHTMLQSDLMVISDATKDVRFADNSFVTDPPHIRFYAGVSLVTDGGDILGSLCVFDQAPRCLTSDQEVALRTLARQVSNKLELAWRVAAQDRLIKERLQAQESKRLLAGAVASASEGIVIVDATSHDQPITYANPAFLALTGYTEHEVLGRNFRFLHGPATSPEAQRQIKQALDAGQTCRVTLLNYRKDGTTFWNELIIAPVLDAGGALTHFVSLQHDITALKDAEASLRQEQTRLIEAQRIGRIGDWAVDLTNMRFIWSAEMYRLMEFDPINGEPSYGEMLTRYHPADLVERNRLFAESQITGNPYQINMRMILPSGTARWCHVVGQPSMDELGQVTQFAGTMLDITKQMEREQQIRDDNLNLAAQKAQLEAAVAKLLALATTDPLTGLLNYRAFQIRLADEAARGEWGGSSAAMAMLDLDGFRFFNEAYGHSVGDAVLRQVATRLKATCSAGDAVARFGGDEFTILLQDLSISMTPQELEARLQAGLDDLSYQPEGVAAAIPISVSVGVALLPRHSTDWRVVVEMAEQRLRRAKTGGDMETEADRVRKQAQNSLTGFSMLDALVTAVDNKDRYTRRHSEDVMEYSLSIARELELDDATQETIAIAALLHDVGKLGVPDAILRKPGPLTEEEFEAIKQHPQMGAIMVTAVPGLEGILDAVRHHHERWDGRGYPLGLQEAGIPLIARLMAVADAYSAMTSDRPYRKGMPSNKALSILRDGAGTQWDPTCAYAFIKSQTAH